MTEQKKASALYEALDEFRGWVVEVERRTGINRNTIRPHVRGDVSDPNPEIIRVAIEVLEERQTQQREMRRLLALNRLYPTGIPIHADTALLSPT